MERQGKGQRKRWSGEREGAEQAKEEGRRTDGGLRGEAERD